MKTALKNHGRAMLAPIARVLANLGVSPDQLTWFGMIASAGAGVLIAFGFFWGAVAALLVGSLCDVLDGSVARLANKSSPFGAFLDSTVDRYAEMFYFAGIMVYFIRFENSVLYAFLAFLAAGGSFMVSYTRARAEGIGIRCDVGIMERPERLIVLLVATMVGPVGVRVALWALTVLVTITTIQRMVHVYRETRPQ